MAEPAPELDAVLFDLDGVLTRTARVHLAAWTRTFDELLSRRSPAPGEDLRPFRELDYRDHVDGRPRLDGIRAFLAARGIALPEGTSEDPADVDTVHGLGRRKNERFHALLDELGVEVDPAAAPLLRSLRAEGVPVAICTSSKNGKAVLTRAGLEGLYDALVDGVESAALGLEGKPAPDIFVTGAARVGARPARSVVLEDATLGAEAGRRGGFGLVIGVDASGENAERLEAAGADWVVRDLSELSVDALRLRLAERRRDGAAAAPPRGLDEAPDDERSARGGAP